MKKTIHFLKTLPKYFWILAAVTGVSQFLTYYLPRVLKSDQLTVLSSEFDDMIPFIPAFVYVYVGAFLFWVWGYLVLYKMNKPIAYRVFTADLMCKAVCITVFCLYPCTMNQPPEDAITGIGAWGLKIVYALDEPTQLLPSMHCYVSILLPMAMLSKYAAGISPRVKIISLLTGVIICLSTLFVKQHVLDDVYTGVALAIVSWAVSLAVWRIVDKKRTGAKQFQESSSRIDPTYASKGDHQ